MISHRKEFTLLCLLLCLGSETFAQAVPSWLTDNCDHCVEAMSTQTGAYILEKGEESLIGRAWLTQNAVRTIDVQYFIWSTDNIGTLAAEYLLHAAERGVVVRVLVDDTLIDAEDRTLLLLSAQPNLNIRIYNPNLTIGVSWWQRMVNAVSNFREVNQRMHDKTAIFDGVAGITGGRNMADEYFDFHQEYNFRDRDILLLGPAVYQMSENFEEFWDSEYAIPVETILEGSSGAIEQAELDAFVRKLHAYADDTANFERQVQDAISAAAESFPELLKAMSWQEVVFISDVPGKNDGESGLQGGGESTSRLIDAVKGAKESILIQSPYLILPEGGIELFAELVERGVRIRVSTNSLASTDNVPAFSGYHGQRTELLEAGVELYEFKPDPGVRETLMERYPSISESDAVFALHAKSMVIDDNIIYIGTFNLEPRSANLNTEVGALIESKELARQLSESIERDMLPENSWQSTLDFNPDAVVSRTKRMRMWFNKMLPAEQIL